MQFTYSQPVSPFHGGLPVQPARSQRLAALGECLMQRLETPLFVTDADGAVLEANPAATRRIERREGLWLDAGGHLALRQAGRWVPLSRWHAQVAAGGELTLPVETDGGVPMQITLRAMPAGVDAHAACWVLATIERVQLTRTDAMRRRFRFTRTQARLAEMLCAGMRPTHAAEQLGVKISTVRTHVGQMYEKTGTHSQAQLVALLHGV
ncbi:MAG: LuxR C-terminal-related transcriptional regulator [Rubrivivax sp.]|nr:LuxR C-terminal-related transcriptional regulator [Rubrivivax sp.]